MHNKYILCLFCSSVIFAVACGDEGDKYREGARCNANNFGNNGSLCEENTLVRCINNSITRYECSDGCEVKYNNATCAMPDTTGCGSVTEKGDCIGGNVVKCVDRKLETTVCTTGTECQRTDSGAYECVQVEELCGDVTANGRCEDNDKTLVYCKSGLIVRESCNPKCISPDGIFYQCFEKCTDALEALGEVGQCDANGYIYCSNQYGTIRQSCGNNETCGKDDNGNYRCLSTSTECGDITPGGMCSGEKTLKYCDNGILKTETCSTRCITLPDTKGAFSQCHEPCGSVTADGVCTTDANANSIIEICDANYGLIAGACAAGTACSVKDGKASCRDLSEQPTTPVLDCNTDEGKNGVCRGSTLYYCDVDGNVVPETCEKKCAVADSGYAQCYADCGKITGEACSEKLESVLSCDAKVGLVIKKACEKSETCQEKNGKIDCYAK